MYTGWREEYTMNRDLSALHEGMQVIGSDGQRVGAIKEVNDGAIVVADLLQPSVAIPHRAIRGVTVDGVVLAITAEQVDDRFWEHAGEDLNVDTTGLYD
jgi:hypothetical protein